jgi:hypothetical protein
MSTSWPQPLPSREEDDRRWKKLDLPIDFPMRFLMWEMLQPRMCIPMHKFKTDTFPDGVRCEAIFYSVDRQCYSYILYHPSWPSVPLGDMIPHVDEEVHIEVYTLGDDPDKAINKLGEAKSWRELPSLLGG